VLGWDKPSIHKVAEVVDASHPATKLPQTTYNKVFPRFSNANLVIRAFPKALLKKPDVSWPDPPYHYPANVKWSEQLAQLRKVAAEGEDLQRLKVDSVDMSMVCVLRKNAVYKRAVIRRKTVGRLKTAVSLLVTRDADVCIGGDGVGLEGPRLVFNHDATVNPHQWILPSTFPPLLISSTRGPTCSVRLDLFIHTFHVTLAHAVPRVNFYTAQWPWYDSYQDKSDRGTVEVRGQRFEVQHAGTEQAENV